MTAEEEARVYKPKYFAVCIAVLGLIYGGVELNRSGKALDVLSGEISGCDNAGFKNRIRSSYVALDGGGTIKMLDSKCRVGETVLVEKKRGLLTFITFYERRDT